MNYSKDKAIVFDNDTEKLPPQVALMYLKNNFKYVDSTQRRKDLHSDSPEVRDKASGKNMGNSEYFSTKIIGNTDCLFEKDKIYMYASLVTQGRKKSKYIGFIPIAYNKSTFFIIMSNEGNFITFEAKKMKDPEDESNIQKILNSSQASYGKERRQEFINLINKDKYHLYCELSADKNINIKKIGSALISLGIKFKSTITI